MPELIFDSFRRYGTIAFSTLVMQRAIKADGDFIIKDWLEMVPFEYIEIVSGIISTISVERVAGKTLEDVKAAFIREIQNQMGLKIKSGRHLLNTLPDFGCPC